MINSIERFILIDHIIDLDSGIYIVLGVNCLNNVFQLFHIFPLQLFSDFSMHQNHLEDFLKHMYYQMPDREQVKQS